MMLPKDVTEVAYDHESAETARRYAKVVQLRENREHKRALREANRIRTERPPLTVGERVIIASLFTAACFTFGALMVWGLR